jgi:hypothetical protein
MHRPGSDPADMTAADFLCDFCGRAWDGASPVVEGHRGSLICGECVAAAYRAVVLGKQNSAPPGYDCRLCLERRPDPGWASPTHPAAAACKRCINQAAGVLSKDKDYGWQRPTG